MYEDIIKSDNEKNLTPRKVFEQMIELPDCDVSKSTDKTGTIKIFFSGKRSGRIVSGSITKNSYGQTSTQSSYREQEKKSNFKKEVKRLKKEGYTQKQIARMLGMSQSYVSILLNS